MTWLLIESIPKDGSDVILRDKYWTITKGCWNDNQNCVEYCWFDCPDPILDVHGQFKYWIPLPLTTERK